VQDLASTLLFSRAILLVAAHPDDETIGAGALLGRVGGRAHLLHLTDGAPRERRWWGAPDLRSRGAYARARREELAAAMAVAGVPPERLGSLGLVDQEASLDLRGLALRVREAIERAGPEVVLTHPYEGGHPDHDAAAFAVHAALGLLEREGRSAPRLVEFTSYHRAADGGVAVGEFLPGSGEEEWTLGLPAEERARKERMLAAFATQQRTLAPFRAEAERFRVAPAYDFTLPPHPEPPHYERFGWGCTGEEWRARARAALAGLGVEAVAPC
jgi:LmbE family N-acetylglucosaminyl deacetylase